MNRKEEADTRRLVRVVRNLEEMNVGTNGKSPKQGLTIELNEGRQSGDWPDHSKTVSRLFVVMRV